MDNQTLLTIFEKINEDIDKKRYYPLCKVHCHSSPSQGDVGFKMCLVCGDILITDPNLKKAK